MNKHIFGLRWFPSGQSRAPQKLGLDPERGRTQGSRSIQWRSPGPAEQKPWPLDPLHHYNPGVVLLTPTPSSTSKELRKHFRADKMQRNVP